MRRASDRLYPVVRAIYGPRPVIDMHTRIKSGLVTLGVIGSARPRPPLLPISQAIAQDIARVIGETGLAV